MIFRISMKFPCNVGNRAAIYLSADIVRDMKVKAGMKVKFYPRTSKSAVLEFEK